MLIALLSSLGFLLVVLMMPLPRPVAPPASALTGLPSAETATAPR